MNERASLDTELSIASGRSQDPFASAVRTTRMPMVITDPRESDNPIVFCNDAFLRLTGYERDEILGRNCRFLQGAATNEDDVAKVRAAVQKREAVEVDLLNYRKDGTTFWNSLLMCPVFDSDELTYFFASQMDVTDRKRSEEHAFLLNRELDHRVKNTLATVQSVVLQTLRDAAVPSSVAAAVSGRLQALARSHDVMTREAWASANLPDVVMGALEPWHGSYGARIAIEGEDFRLKPRIATMMSLAVHELGENALRHGSLSSGGCVKIHWTIEGDRFAFQWREEGGASIDRPQRRGYGLRIIEKVLAAEFGGTAIIDFAPDGLVFRLDAPRTGLGREQTEWSMEANGLRTKGE